MLGFGSNKPNGCGVLRTCCPLLGPGDLLAAQQVLGLSGAQPSYPSQMGQPSAPAYGSFGGVGGGHGPTGHGFPPSFQPPQGMAGVYPPQPPQYTAPYGGNKYMRDAPAPSGSGYDAASAYAAMHSQLMQSQAMQSSAHQPITMSVKSSRYQPKSAYAELLGGAGAPYGRLAQLQGRCGFRPDVQNQARVQNLQYPGSSTEFGEFPWQAALLKRLGPADSLFVCGATLLSNEWAATAAHCIKKLVDASL